jgi:cytoskeleton protein RodZ
MSKAGFGEHLRREREMRGVSLDEICVATRISTRFLDALENEEWEHLPGGVFNRGFVRSVARYLGMDEDGLVAEYALAMSAHSGTPVWTNQHPQKLAAHWPANPQANWPLRLGIFLAVLVLAVGGWAGWRRYAVRRTSQSAAAQVVSTPATAGTAGGEGAASAAAPAVTSESPAPPAVNSTPAPASSAAPIPGQPPVQATVQPATGGLQLKIVAGKATTVTITADGKTAFKGSFTAGQTRTFSARNRIDVRAHDAGAVSLELNGQAVAPFGRPGHSGRVALTRRDVKPAAGGPD